MTYGKRMYKSKTRGRKRKAGSTKRRKKRKQYKRRGRVTPAKIRALVRKVVNDVEIVQDARVMENFQLTAAVNTRETKHYDCFNNSSLEALLDETRPTIDGTGVQWNDMRLSNRKMVVTGGFDKYLFANNYNYTVEMEIFTFKTTDHAGSSVESYLNGLFHRYVVDSSQDVFATAEDSMLYSYSDVAKKSKHHKLLRKSKIFIRPGETVAYTFPFKGAKLAVALDDWQASGGITYVRGITVQHLFTLRGQVAHGAEADSQSSNVGFSDCKLDVIRECRMKYKFTGKTLAEKSELKQETLDAMTNPNVVQIETEEKTDVIG